MKFNSSGQVSRLFLILAVIIFVAIIITFLVMKMAERPAKPAEVEETTIPLPVYEVKLGNIRFVFQSALDKGETLKTSDIVNAQYSSGQSSLQISNPGAKFIKVTVGAQNKGTVNTEENSWRIGNIVDSEGRNYVPVEGYTVSPWIPYPDKCGALLKPAFDPTPCTKIYEVSKESTGLKILVETGVDNTSNNLSSGKTETALLDLVVK